MGKYLLNSKEIECKWQQSDNTKPVGMIKKKIGWKSNNNCLQKKVKAFDSYVVKPALTAKQTGKVFKATGGGVKLTKSGKSIDFIFEVVRREIDWEKKFIDKMKFYKDFYDNYCIGDSGYKNMPQLILVCEDDKHMAETFKQIVTNSLELSNITLLFTTDLRQNEENLSKSLIQFKLDATTQKYKVQNVELKLLES